MYGCLHNTVRTVMRPSELYNGHSRAGKTQSVQNLNWYGLMVLAEIYGELLRNIQENNKRINIM